MRIDLKLTKESLDDAIRKVKAYRDSLPTKAMAVAELFAEVMQRTAQNEFDGFSDYAGDNEVNVSVVPDDNGYIVRASGNAVAFIEFGAGVYYNTFQRDYPLDIPAGIVDIGEWGLHNGRKEYWVYYGDPGLGGEDIGGGFTLTHGNPPAYAMVAAIIDAEHIPEADIRRAFKNAGR